MWPCCISSTKVLGPCCFSIASWNGSKCQSHLHGIQQGACPVDLNNLLPFLPLGSLTHLYLSVPQMGWWQPHTVGHETKAWGKTPSFESSSWWECQHHVHLNPTCPYARKSLCYQRIGKFVEEFFKVTMILVRLGKTWKYYLFIYFFPTIGRWEWPLNLYLQMAPKPWSALFGSNSCAYSWLIVTIRGDLLIWKTEVIA